MKRFSNRDLRALLVGVGVLAVAAVGTRGIPRWWSALGATLGEAHQERRALSDARAVIGAAQALRDTLVARRMRLLAAAPALVIAPTPAAAASQLSALVATAASSSGIVVGSLSLRSDTATTSTFGRPAVSGTARGDLSGFAQFLLLLELGPPLLRVTEFTIAQPEPASTGRPEELRVTFVVEAVANVARVAGATGAQK